LQKLEVEVVHTDVKVDSDFKSSNSVLNWIYQAFVRTELCNMHDGFPSDCPHRERLGYTGDGQMTAFSAMLTLDSKEFYKKWIQDIADGQNLENGHVQYTAPFMGGGGGPGGWGGAIIFVVYSYYKRYGDLEIVEEYFSNMLKYVEYMQAHSINGLVSNAEEGCWCLGDWASQDKNLPDTRLVNSVLFVHALNQLSQMAKDIGKKKYVDGFNAKIKEIKTAIQKEFYDVQTCSFDNGRTGADAFALSIGLGNEQTLKNLVEKYSKLGRVDTGFIGIYYLIKTLLENDQIDLAYELLTTTKKGSFGYMKKQGATTINEHLDMGNYVSDCHPMFGSVCELLFTHILGLQISNDKEFLICPKIPTKLKNAKGTITVGKEKITLGFDQSKDKINYVANIPLDKKAILVYKNKTYKLLSGKNKVELSQ
jgi:alpha-L-rhamnosidase